MATSSNAVWSVGRRKTAIARLRLKEGTGKIQVNYKDINDYITLGKAKIEEAIKPLVVLNQKDKFDLFINVKGGGVNGQIGAIRHAVARALVKKNPDIKGILKKEGFLTRDSRMVERKKYGRHKARRGTQFSKR